MPRKSKRSITRALPAATAAPRELMRPRKEPKETIVVRTESTRTRERQAGSLGGKGTLLPIIGGVGGGAAVAYAMQRLNWHPVAVAGATAAVGLFASREVSQPWLKQATAAAAIGAAAIGGVTLLSTMRSTRPVVAEAARPGAPAPAQRSADGDGGGFVTRGDLNDALSKLADSHREVQQVQQRQTCDLIGALRDEIRSVIAEGPNGSGAVASNDNRRPAPSASPSYTYPFTPSSRPTSDAPSNRDADVSDYERNAYGEDVRDAGGDEYAHSAYGPGSRDAALYDEERDADGDERDADGDERDADGDERDAASDDERDADADWRDATGDDERDADIDE